MVRVLCILPLALAAVSAVSGHVIQRQHKSAPSGWETSILQDYDAYHTRYLEWGCQKQHNTTFFAKCCHPLLKGEPMSAIESLGCGCEEDDSSVPPSPTPTPSSTPQAVQANTSPSAPPSSSPKPANAALAKGNETPTSTPSSTPPPATPTSTPAKSSTSPPPAQTGGSGSGNGGDKHSGGVATFFYQHGTPGACGTVHSDDAPICAIDSALYNQNICGKSVQITNTKTKQSIVVTVADECPTCDNANSIDLSHGAFGLLNGQDFAEGQVPIEWSFL